MLFNKRLNFKSKGRKEDLRKIKKNIERFLYKKSLFKKSTATIFSLQEYRCNFST